MTPASIQFIPAPGKSCAGCLFEHERSTVCHEAVRIAVRAGQPDCEYAGIIYIAKPIDERQLDLLAEEETNE